MDGCVSDRLHWFPWTTFNILICHTSLKTVCCNHCRALVCNHDVVVSVVYPVWLSWWNKHRGLPRKVLFYNLYVPFRDFSCAFSPTTVVSVTVCLVVRGASFSSEMSCSFFFFLMSLLASSLSRWWHTVGAKIKIPYVENPERWNFLHLKPEVGQSIAIHASPTARKVSIVVSDTCLPSPSTRFFQNHFTFFKKKIILGQWQIMKSRLQTWLKHCRFIACASAFYSLLVWLWVKMCRNWVSLFITVN